MPLIVVTEHADGERTFARPEGTGIALCHELHDPYILDETTLDSVGFAALCKSETDGDVVAVKFYREVP